MGRGKLSKGVGNGAKCTAGLIFARLPTNRPQRSPRYSCSMLTTAVLQAILSLLTQMKGDLFSGILPFHLCCRQLLSSLIRYHKPRRRQMRFKKYWVFVMGGYFFTQAATPLLA